MLNYIVTFFILAVIAAFFGFGGLGLCTLDKFHETNNHFKTLYLSSRN